MPEIISIDFTVFKPKLQLKQVKGKYFVFDPIRQKWLVLQPEEMVRQLVVLYLISEKGYNPNRIKVEKGLKVHKLEKRCDILVYDLDVMPFLMVECKAPHIDIRQETLDQIARYNIPLQVPYLMVTNGFQTYCCQIDFEKQTYEYLSDVPVFPEELKK